jgi:OOP family OmpA-OmpF porin
MNTATVRALALAAAVAMVLGSAQAGAEEGKWMARVRAINIDPANNSGPIPALGINQDDVVDVSKKWAPDIDFEYFFTPRWSSELLLTIPQKHKAAVVVGNTRIPLGSFKHLPPTLTLKYNFNPDGWLRPYAGIGVNYTRIMNVKLAVPGATPLPLDLDKNSFGMAYQLGFDVKFTDHWFGSVDVKWVDIDADVKVKASGVKVTTANVDPTIWGVGIGYRFGGTKAAAPIAAAAAAPIVAAPPPPDADGDGVIDANDRCPGTPAGAKVDANGCELDADMDGVVDRLDKCPGTPAGIKVDAAGCEIEEIVLKGVTFDTNKATLKDSSVGILDGVVEMLRKRPDAKVEIRGYTDSVGKDAYNLKLSESRAKAVVDYLVSKGIPAGNLSAKGFGEADPIASNDTPEGREQNRRVTLQFATLATK